MANRRMFCKDITSSDKFRILPLASQGLYLQLGMEADDRGYVDNPITLMRAVGATQKDMDVLVENKFILIRSESLILIKGWKINNYIQKDRFNETKYTDDLKTLYYDENYSYTEKPTDKPCIHNVYNMDTQLSIGKVSIVKDSIVKDRVNNKKENKVINEKKEKTETDDFTTEDGQFDEKKWNEELKRIGGA